MMSKPNNAKLAPIASYIFNPSPGPMNCTTFTATRTMVEDRSHPLHIRTQRQLAQFDTNSFHFRVHCPIDISKKAVIRDTVKQRFKSALVTELVQRGWAANGEVLESEKKYGSKSGLKGAFLLNIAKDPKRVLQASKEEIRIEVSRMVGSLVAKQRTGASTRTRSHEWNATQYRSSGGSLGKPESINMRATEESVRSDRPVASIRRQATSRQMAPADDHGVNHVRDREPYRDRTPYMRTLSFAKPDVEASKAVISGRDSQVG
jgi:hypothetical protein